MLRDLVEEALNQISISIEGRTEGWRPEPPWHRFDIRPSSLGVKGGQVCREYPVPDAKLAPPQKGVATSRRRTDWSHMSDAAHDSRLAPLRHDSQMPCFAQAAARRVKPSVDGLEN
jgi:hypothetical protein